MERRSLSGASDSHRLIAAVEALIARLDRVMAVQETLAVATDGLACALEGGPGISGPAVATDVADQVVEYLGSLRSPLRRPVPDGIDPEVIADRIAGDVVGWLDAWSKRATEDSQ